MYRDFLIRYLQHWFLLSVAIIAAAAVFALDHVYQGARGAVVAFVIGLALTGLFVMAGSLWLPITIHAAIDLRLLEVRA